MSAINQLTAQNQQVWGNHFNSGSGGEADSQENDSFWQALSAQPATNTQSNSAPQSKQTAQAEKSTLTENPAQDEEELRLDDLIDIVNPLHHIPVVSAFYRELSGDQITPAARVAGGVLFGGPVGAGFAVANIAVEAALGQDIGASVLAMFNEDGGPADSSPEQTALLASAKPDQKKAAPGNPAETAPSKPQNSGPSQAEQTNTAAFTQNINGSKLDAFIAKHAQKAGNGFDPADIRVKPRYPVGQPEPVTSAQPPMPPIPGKSSDPSEISNWMLRTLDQYQHMKKGTPGDDGQSS